MNQPHLTPAATPAVRVTLEHLTGAELRALCRQHNGPDTYETAAQRAWLLAYYTKLTR